MPCARRASLLSVRGRSDCLALQVDDLSLQFGISVDIVDHFECQSLQACRGKRLYRKRGMFDDITHHIAHHP
jgi:hypothetical protein